MGTKQAFRQKVVSEKIDQQGFVLCNSLHEAELMPLQVPIQEEQEVRNGFALVYKRA